MDPRRISAEQKEHVLKLHRKGLTTSVIAQRVGISPRTVLRVVREGSK